MAKANFGSIRKLPSGKYQARYTGPDGRTHTGPTTFERKADAGAYLSTVRADVERDAWRPTGRKNSRGLTFGEYVPGWLDGRRVKGRPLSPRTRHHYDWLLEQFILPTFANTPMKMIDPEDVDAWHATTATGSPTAQAHAYSLLRSILTTAVERGYIRSNPAVVRGAGVSPTRKRDTEPATPAELRTMAEAMPARFALMVMLAGWCALRFGELAELRRSDIDTKTGRIKVRRSVVRAGSVVVLKGTKSDAGVRDLDIPPPLLPLVRDHLLQHCAPGKDGLLFPGANGLNLAQSTFKRYWYLARNAAGRPDLRFHDLRSTALTAVAQTGATTAEIMKYGGHSTPQAAQRYQQAAKERMSAIAGALGAMMEAGE